MTLINAELYEREAPATSRWVTMIVEAVLAIGAAVLLAAAIAMAVMAVTS